MARITSEQGIYETPEQRRARARAELAQRKLAEAQGRQGPAPRPTTITAQTPVERLLAARSGGYTPGQQGGGVTEGQAAIAGAGGRDLNPLVREGVSALAGGKVVGGLAGGALGRAVSAFRGRPISSTRATNLGATAEDIARYGPDAAGRAVRGAAAGRPSSLAGGLRQFTGPVESMSPAARLAAVGATAGPLAGITAYEPAKAVAEGFAPQAEQPATGDDSAVDRFIQEKLAEKGITLDPNRSVLEQAAELQREQSGPTQNLIDQTQPNLAQTARSTSPFTRQPPVTEAPSLVQAQEPEVPGTPATTPDLGAPPVRGTPATGTPNLGGAGGGPLDQITTDILSELNQLSAGLASSKSPDVGAVFMQQAQSIIELLNRQEQELRSEAEASGTQVDPSTQFSLDTMRQRLDESLKSTREELNRRGLFHSGILIEAEQMLRKGNLSDEARVLADRLTGITQRLEENLRSIRSQRTNVASQFGLAGAQAAFQGEQGDLNRRQDLVGQVQRGRLELRGQLSAEDRARETILENRRAAQEQREFERQNALEQRQFQAEQAGLTRESQSQQLEREIGAGRFERSSGGSASATQNIIAHLLSTAPTYEAALSQLQAEMAELVAVGVDMQAVLREISQLPRAGTRQTGGPQF